MTKRKLISPKNSLTLLNELKGVVVSNIYIHNNVCGFKAIVEVNGKTYGGHGNTKMEAKSSACDKALRDILVAKLDAENKRLIEKPLTHTTSTEGNGNGFTPSTLATEASGTDGDSGGTDSKNEMTMIHIASFALFKLLSEWKAEGYFIPQQFFECEYGGTAKTAPKEPKKRQLPSNWETMHPTTLLLMMRPEFFFVECGSFVEDGNIYRRFSGSIDKYNFIAAGKSKKIARRNVAIKICNALFGTNYDEAMSY